MIRYYYNIILRGIFKWRLGIKARLRCFSSNVDRMPDYEMTEVEQTGVMMIIMRFTPSLCFGNFNGIKEMILTALFAKALPAVDGYAKFPVGYEMGSEGKTVSFTLGSGITLMDKKGEMNFKELSDSLGSLITSRGRSEDSNQSIIHRIILRVYMTRSIKKEERKIVSKSEAIKRVLELSSPIGGNHPEKVKEPKKPSIMRRLRQSSVIRKGFLVADIERIMNDQDQHLPYAIGIMEVSVEESLPSKDSISWWYSEDIINEESFAVRSKLMMNAFLTHLETLVKKQSNRTIYFHNLSRFDGILLIKHMV